MDMATRLAAAPAEDAAGYGHMGAAGGRDAAAGMKAAGAHRADVS